MKNWKLILPSILLVAIIVLAVSCGKQVVTTAESFEMSIGGKTNGLSATQVNAIRAMATSVGNSSYTDVYQSPTAFGVSTFKGSLLTSATDTSPYVIFNKGGVDDAEYYNLGGTTATTFGSNETIPDAGTYTHVKLGLVYMQMTFNMDLGSTDNAGYTSHNTRLYCSTITDTSTAADQIQDGDVMFEVNGSWNWINLDNGTFSSTRPANPVQDSEFSTTASADPYYETIALTSSVTIPANPTGTWTGTFTFDGTDMFFFDDVDNDGKFEPGVQAPNGDANMGSNVPLWWPEAPGVTCAFTTS